MMIAEIAELASQINGTVITSEDPDYDEIIKRWASNAERNAAVIVLVTCPADIAAALAFGKRLGMEIAVSGGRHSASGASSAEGGLVIDLRKMRNVKVNTDTNRVIAQGGCLWADVDAALAKYDLATVGGTVNHTGIGGLTLGGGWGYLSGQYGLVVDNLRNVEIVLASGDIVQANDNENSDLFWGIRGGGCNFGVVTEFTYEAYPHPQNVYSGLIVFTPYHLEALVETFNAWHASPDGKNSKVAFFIAVAQSPPEFQPSLICLVFYDGDETEGRRIFKPFFDLAPVVDLTKTHPYVEQNGLLNEMTGHGTRRYIKATDLYRLTVSVLRTLFDSFVEYVQTVGPDTVASLCLIEYIPSAKLESVPTDATAFNYRGPWLNCTLSPNWGNTTKWDAYARKWCHDLVDKLAKLEKEEGAAGPGKEVVGQRGYFNGSLGDEKSSMVFGVNYPRLKDLKRRYDPEMVFRKWYPITPTEG